VSDELFHIFLIFLGLVLFFMIIVAWSMR